MKESGVWLSLVERCVRDAEAGGSNPLTPTSTVKCRQNLSDFASQISSLGDVAF